MPRLNRIKHLIVTGCGALLVFGVINFFGKRQFGAFDSSALIDVGYRLFLGQRAYHDFVQATPPLFSAGAGYAFKWFGLSWNSLVRISAIWAIICFLSQLWLLVRMGLPFLKAWTISLLFAALAFFPLSYWWYNSITSSLCTLLFTSTLVLLTQPKIRRSDFVFFVGVLTLTSLSKPNAAGLTILTCSAALVASKTSRYKALIAIFLSAIAAVVVLHFLEVNIFEMISSYLGISGRAYPSSDRFVQSQRLTVVVISKLMILSLCALFLCFIETRFPKSISKRTNTMLPFVLMTVGLFALDSVGPRLQFAYAAFGVVPPLGMPSWWDPGVTFSESQTSEMENKFFNTNFDICIFWRQDFTYLSDKFRFKLEESYKVVRDGSVRVYQRKRT
ncbi:MAG: hypothetical protein ACKN9V_09990 [Pseudomonadota bacterium]